MSGYGAASVLDAAEGLRLETAEAIGPAGRSERPRFFSGMIARPELLSAGLLAVADVAATAYFDASVASRSLDPVVTASGDRLRFESFSRCNGVHARLDLLEGGIHGGDVGFGTTNVDVNPPLRTALAALAPSELLHLEVGRDELRVATPQTLHVERRVKLPDRWLRGFAEVPDIAAGLRPVAELGRVEAMRFLAALPRTAPGPVLDLAPVGATLRTAPLREQAVVRLAGTARLGAARRMARFVDRMRVHAHPGGASAWVLEAEGVRLTLLISPEPYRGFSGEGGLLEGLARARAEDAERVAEHLAWQPVIDPVALAADTGLAPGRVRDALDLLAASGRTGFDIVEQAWFHRELPLEPDRAPADNPRLRKARRLAEEGAVHRDGDRWRVVTEGSEHWLVEGDRLRCTCPWETRHRGARGPCAHALAVGMVQRAG